MYRSSWSLLLVLIPLLVGCAGSFEYTPRPLMGGKWQASAVAVSVADPRADAASTLPRVPAMTMGNDGQTKDMRLPPEFTQFVRWRLAQLVTQQGPRFRLIIVPESVRAGWSSTLWAETEAANVSLTFRITTEDGSRVLLEGHGKRSQSFSSTDASDEELARVFRATCNDSFDAFFGSAANVKLLNDLARAPARPLSTLPARASLASARRAP
jgi:hypothetical protein